MVRSIYYTNFQSRLINYNIFVVERYGLRRRLSTDNGTRWFVEIILNVWNNNRYIVGVLCGRSKVFVCANHKLSLEQTTTLCSQRQTLRSAYVITVQQDRASGIEVLKYVELFFKWENCKMWCFCGICIGYTAV